MTPLNVKLKMVKSALRGLTDIERSSDIEIVLKSIESDRSLNGHCLLWHGVEPPREAAEKVAPLLAGLEGQRSQEVDDSEIVLRAD